MTIFSAKMRVCAICHVAILAEDDVYRPQKYQEMLLCGDCGREFHKWEMMEQSHRGHITVKLCKCGCVLDAHFDFKRKFYDTKWTKERIIRDIRTIEKEGWLRHCYRLNPALWNAARRRFGNWRNAIRAARIPSGR